MVTTNPNLYGASNTDTANPIEDGVDFPHTGLLKALSTGLTGTYAISGFNASSVTATAITIAAGVIIRNGEKVAVTGATLAISASHTNGYNLLVAPSGATPTVVIRGSTAPDKVPAYTDKDTIIAVLTHTATNPMQIQFLTLNPKTNSLSIAYDSSGYTETMSITGNANRTLFKNKIATSDIRFVLANNTANEKFEIYSDDDSDGDEGDTSRFSVDGLGATVIGGTATVGTDLTVTGGDIILANAQNGTLGVATTGSGTDGRDLTLSAGSAPAGGANQNGGDLILNAGSGDGTGTSIMTFNTKVNGTDTVAERMRIHTDGKVGIGTNAPDHTLEVAGEVHITSASAANALLIESTEDSSSAAPDIMFYRNRTPANGDDIAMLKWRSKNDAAATHDYASIFVETQDVADGAEDGRMQVRTSVAGSTVKRITIDSTCTTFNEEHLDLDFRVESDTVTHALFVQGSDGNVGIGVAAPDTQLHVAGTIKTDTIFQSGALVSVSSPGPGASLTLSKGIHVVSAPALPGGGPLALIGLEATAENVGIHHKIIVTAVAGAPAIVTLDWTASSQVLVSTTDSTIGGTSSPYTLAAGKAYDLVCIAVNKWMLILLN
tara:strand:- start:5046 stop:6866 length:1821 start_codon:yes stop_codon:yes gene_type:complete